MPKITLPEITDQPRAILGPFSGIFSIQTIRSSTSVKNAAEIKRKHHQSQNNPFQPLSYFTIAQIRSTQTKYTFCVCDGSTHPLFKNDGVQKKHPRPLPLPDLENIVKALSAWLNCNLKLQSKSAISPLHFPLHKYKSFSQRAAYQLKAPSSYTLVRRGGWSKQRANEAIVYFMPIICFSRQCWILADGENAPTRTGADRKRQNSLLFHLFFREVLFVRHKQSLTFPFKLVYDVNWRHRMINTKHKYNEFNNK